MLFTIPFTIVPTLFFMYFICVNITTGWWRSWLARRSHSCEWSWGREFEPLSPQIRSKRWRKAPWRMGRHVVTFSGDSSTSELRSFFSFLFSPASQTPHCRPRRRPIAGPGGIYPFAPSLHSSPPWTSRRRSSLHLNLVGSFGFPFSSNAFSSRRRICCYCGVRFRRRVGGGGGGLRHR